MSLPPIVALEIGTTTVRAMVGEMSADHEISIIGAGEAPSVGVRKGEITDLENVIVCVRAALADAESTSKVMIRDVHLAVSGCQIQSMTGCGSVSVGEAGEVMPRHVDEVMDIARTTNLPPERTILHSVCMNFRIDDEASVINPEGLSASKLSLDMLIVHGNNSRMANLITAAESVPMDVHDLAFSGICAALSVLTSEQKKSGAIVIDLGGGTTNWAAYAGDVPCSSGSLGVGGDHVTNDIALAFNISTGTAELLKKTAGSACVDARLTDETINVPEELGFSVRPIKRKSLHTVINARMEETFRAIRKRLEREHILPHIGSGVVLTGGGARLAGVAELAGRIFGLPCHVGRPYNISGFEAAFDGPEHAVCSGMIIYGYKNMEDYLRHSGVSGWFRKMFGRDK